MASDFKNMINKDFEETLYLDRLYLDRAKNELDLANSIFKISENINLKRNLELKDNTTFYSNVIAVSYYCIFYSAKAILLKHKIKTDAPEEHKKTLDEFEKLVKKGILDKELFKIYKDISIKANDLLGIFIIEKSKRGKFTYKKLPQANKEPAIQSLKNAEKFYKSINLILKNNENNKHN
ncbi:MAG: hypothetical protein QXR96_03700 [Candidatus Woesearchaeota archaeon]